MRAPRSLLCLLFAWLFAMPAHAFEDKTLGVAADQYRAALIAQAGKGLPPDTQAKADAALKAKKWGEAIVPLELLVRTHPDDGPLWLKLARARGNNNPQDERARPAAYAALRLAKSAEEQAAALFVLGRLTEVNQDGRAALAMYDEGLALVPDEGIARRAANLRATLIIKPVNAAVEEESATPRFCVEFSDPLSKARQYHYEDFVQTEPAVRLSVTVRDNKLCAEGAEWGQGYRVTVRAGVPGAKGDRTASSETFTLTFPDRKPSVAFRGNGYVLPRKAGQMLPVVSVNLPAAELKLLRINDRNLIREVLNGSFDEALYGSDEDAIASDRGEEVWHGSVEFAGDKNRETVTLLPLKTVLPETKPGVYVLTARPPRKQAPAAGDEDDDYDYDVHATQWLIVSDLGLTVMRGADGLHVFVRSLESGRPAPNVELRLLARNNTELATVTSDAEGRAKFDPGLLRASGGRAVRGLYAYGPGGDFNLLDLGQPAFDLSDRGVEGRVQPVGLDAFLYTERGVYRPGEAVELSALLRDAGAAAVENLPVTLIVRRPDGEEAERRVLAPGAPGAYHTRLELPANARSGTWTARLHAEPDGPAIGERRFQVEDFVPQQIKVELATDQPFLTPDSAVVLAISGQFLYGAPAAGLPVEMDATLEADPDPYPQFAGYRFGLVQDEWEPAYQNLEGLPQATDEEGRAVARIEAPPVPDTGRPLRLSVRVGIEEPGGRPVRRVVRLPYRTTPYALGIRPGFDAGQGLKQGAAAPFELIAVGADGKVREAKGLRWELYRENWDYYWFHNGDTGRFDYKLLLRDGAPVAGGALDIGMDAPAKLNTAALDYGPYRLEVYDPAGTTASSVRFTVGWYAAPSAGDRPDQLRVTLDQPRYAAGASAKVRVQPPFAGEVLLTVVSHKLWLAHSQYVPAEGATIDLPVDADWGPGVYVSATAFRAGREAPAVGPGRAIGLAWLALDDAPRRLDVKLDAPAEWRPRQTVQLPVTLSGADGSSGGKGVTLTVAAVDEGILQLTDFETPDPVAWYLGKRRLGLDMLDVYGRLIAPAEGRAGELRSGGDADSRLLDGAQLKHRQSVALFSGFVTPDAQGRVSVPLALPDFNGRLRLMAVAWDRTRVGRGEAQVPVRDPLVAEAYLPRFLAPGDHAQVRTQFDDLAAVPGDWQVQYAVSGPVTIDGPAAQTLALGNGRPKQVRGALALSATGVGDARLTLTVTGPDGSRIEREWPFTVRAAQAVQTFAETRALAPGAKLALGADLLGGWLPGSGRVDVLASSRPPIDVPALLDALDRYPYGCAEQTTSRALPLLYANDLARDWLGGEAVDPALPKRVQDAIARLLAQQRSDGGFGLWRALDDPNPWLNAYVMNFLVRAKEQGYLVPEVALKHGLAALHDALNSRSDPDERELATRAASAYVLARAQAATPGELRYLHDAWLAKMPTELAAAQLGAALARYGDSERARAAFDHAFALQARPYYWWDYGSALRDRAALLALATEAGQSARIGDLATDVAREADGRRYLSTQEQAWLLLAAQALGAGQGQLAISRDGAPWAQGKARARLRPEAAALERGLTLANDAQAQAWVRVTRSGIPSADQPAASEGITVTRQWYTLDGKPLPPGPGPVKAGTTLVAVIGGEVAAGEYVQGLVVDLLPAGFELENAALGPNRAPSELPWLPALTEPDHVELRDDRYVAAIGLEDGTRRFTLAYLVRAITPGDYRVPAVLAEDMYRPQIRGRGAMGRVKIE